MKYPVARRESYIERKFDRSKDHLVNAVKHKYIQTDNTNVEVEKLQPMTSPSIPLSDYYNSLVRKIKQKLDSTNDNSEKQKLLTLVPQSWSMRQVADTFGCTISQAFVARNARNKSGILTCRPSKLNRPLSDETKQLIRDFHLDDLISRTLPGIKDVINVNGVSQQKHLLLTNLKETYVTFQEQHPDIKVGHSRFADLRPKQVILPDVAGLHKTCVCLKCENVKLMLFVVPGSCRISELFEDTACSIYSTNCMFGKCEVCQEQLELVTQQMLRRVDQVATISFKQWTVTDREKFTSVQLTREDFCEQLTQVLATLREHYFYYKSRAAFYKDLRENLQDDEALVLLDFAQNYQYVYQDEPQAVYFAKPQATIHPVFIYYLENGEKTQTYCIVSDDTEHDVVFVMCLIGEVVKRICCLSQHIRKIQHLTDGARSQYKNKFIMFFLTIHHLLFNGIKAEWHFHATAHGKSPCDGAGATYKRLLRRECIRLPKDQKITTARGIYEWGKKNLGMGVLYIAEEQHLSFREWWQTGKTTISNFAGISRYHSFRVDDDGRTVTAKFTSNGQDHKSLKMTRNEDDAISSCIAILDML